MPQMYSLYLSQNNLGLNAFKIHIKRFCNSLVKSETYGPTDPVLKAISSSNNISPLICFLHPQWTEHMFIYSTAN